MKSIEKVAHDLDIFAHNCAVTVYLEYVRSVA